MSIKQMDQELLESAVIDLLRSVDIHSAIPTLRIAKSLLGKDGRCKHVNPVLYRLKDKFMIDKITTPTGGDPRWYCTWKIDP